MKSRLSEWRDAIVPPPDPSAAIGSALRHAFPIDRTNRSLDPFAELLARLGDRR